MILSVGIVPVRKHQEEWQFLLLRCFKYWDFPKGELDPGEVPMEAALREVTEETGITELEFIRGEEFYETEPYSRGKIARYYLAQVNGSPEIVLLPNPENGIVEHHEYRWVSFQDGLELTNPRIEKVLEWANRKLHA